MYNAYEITGRKILGLDGHEYTVMRRVSNKFATTTEGHIIKLSNGEILPADEPLFLMRARDRLAVKFLNNYIEISSEDGCNDFHFDLMNKSVNDFMEFRKLNPDKMKQPSITRGK